MVFHTDDVHLDKSGTYYWTAHGAKMSKEAVRLLLDQMEEEVPRVEEAMQSLLRRSLRAS